MQGSRALLSALVVAALCWSAAGRVLHGAPAAKKPAVAEKVRRIRWRTKTEPWFRASRISRKLHFGVQMVKVCHFEAGKKNQFGLLLVNENGWKVRAPLSR
jgi:hypothetical protein